MAITGRPINSSRRMPICCIRCRCANARIVSLANQRALRKSEAWRRFRSSVMNTRLEDVPDDSVFIKLSILGYSAIAAQNARKVHRLTAVMQTLSSRLPWLLSRKIGLQTGDGTEGFRRDRYVVPNDVRIEEGRTPW